MPQRTTSSVRFDISNGLPLPYDFGRGASNKYTSYFGGYEGRCVPEIEVPSKNYYPLIPSVDISSRINVEPRK